MAAREPVAVVVGRNCARLRLEAGLTRDAFTRYARAVGLRWTASKCADFEHGRHDVTLGTALAVSWALSSALADAKRRGAACAKQSVTLADLLVSDGNIVLSPDGPDPLGSVVADVCRGRPWPTDKAAVLGPEETATQELHQQVITFALSRAIVDGYLDPSLTAADLEGMRRRFGLAEDRLAAKLHISRDRLAALSFRLWDGRTFGEERDRRAGRDANRQKKAQVSRALRAELEKALADGDD